MMPTRSGSRPHSFDFQRTMRMARLASSSGAGLPVLGRMVVFEDNASHSQRVQPLCDFYALVFGGEELIAATRADDDRCPGRFILWRQVDGDSGDVASVVRVAGIAT